MMKTRKHINLKIHVIKDHEIHGNFKPLALMSKSNALMIVTITIMITIP